MNAPCARQHGFVVLFIMTLGFSVLAAGLVLGQEGEPGGDTPVDAPRIMQVRVLPDGSLIAVSQEKGGLYRSQPGGRNWRKVTTVPDAFLHHVDVDPGGNIVLSSDDGLWRSRGDGFERVLRGPIASAHFAPDGAKVLVKVWGRGVYLLGADDLSADTVRSFEDLARRKRELEQRSRDLMTTIGEFNSVNATQEEVQAQLRHYRQWQEAQEKMQALEREQDRASLAAPGALVDEAVTCAVMTGDGVWMAGTFGHGVFGTRHGQGDWSPLSTGLSCRWIVSMAVAPWGAVYAGTYGAGLWVWRPEHSDWVAVSPLLDASVILDVAFGRSGLCVVATQDHGVFVSQDQGRSWSGRDVAGASVQTVGVGPGGQIWAGAWDGGLYASADQGASWRQRPFAHVVRVVGLAFAQDGTGYAALAGLGLFRSDDGGHGWTFVSTPVRPAKDLSLAVDRLGRVFLGSRFDGLWRSEDRGRTWHKDMRGLPDGGVNHVAVSPAGLTLAVPTEASGLFVRSDGGEWSRAPMAGEDDWDYSVWETRFLPDGRYVAYGYQDLAVSEDEGRTWRRERFGQAFRALGVDMHGAIFTERMLGTFVLNRGSGDRDWAEAGQIPGNACTAFVPAWDGMWLGAGLHGGIRGIGVHGDVMTESWQALEGRDVFSMAVGPAGTIFVGLEEGLAVSRDQGQTWQQVVIADD